MRKKIIIVVIFILLMVGGYIYTDYYYPQYSGRFPFILILVFLDFYLYNGVKDFIQKRKRILRYSLKTLFWIPFAAIILSLIISPIDNLGFWNSNVRTIFFGLVFSVYAVKIIPLLFFIASDFITLINKKKKVQHNTEKTKITRKNFLKTVGLAGGGIMFATMFVGMFKWAYQFKVHHIKIKPENFSDKLNGLKIVQLSDIHLGSWVDKKAIDRAVEIINDLNPDIVLFTGDLVNYQSLEALPFTEKLKLLKAKIGIYCILGNHDYGDYLRWPSKKAKENNMEILFDFYKEIGWDLLLNENRIIEFQGEKLALIGVQNWSHYKHFPKYGDLTKAVKGTETINAKLLMSHDPTHWHYEIKENWPEIKLTLSGHTHGFQFGVETPKFKWSPSQWIYPEWAGLYTHHSSQQHIYVNRGLGTIGYPGRIGILPEISLIEIG
ncbi:MAG: metallophosphoesterase [Bacteroidales bacterium]